MTHTRTHQTVRQLCKVASQSAPGAERVRGHAALALVNVLNPVAFSRELLDSSKLLPGILAAVMAVIRECRPSEQRHAMSAIGAVAQVAEDGFRPYYAGFMPVAKNVLATMNGKEHRQLRGQTMEAMALVGLAVGKEMFAKDGVGLVQALLAAQKAGFASDDPQFEYVAPTTAPSLVASSVPTLLLWPVALVARGWVWYTL